ncbi:hypothetical protein [Moellerella wisconsensis]|uniref:Lipoprotein n=1 Tax=Moellerella wisconsensis TaxID=158849 RepID=A0A9Q8Q3K7_9GAMM|nr:hypothetical protein [Moellerella wisconsensis]UNH31351.1 hypothetical protein MNY72_03245 [Moellerella wisconsensis]
MKINVVFIILLLSGCTSKPLFYNDFSPPKDSKQVNIAVEAPAIAEVLPLNVMYRSYKCQVSSRISEREYRDVPGFHNMEILLNRQGNTNVFAKNIPLDGGGRCDWRLSNIITSLKFSKAHPLSINVDSFIGRNLVFIFDTNPPKITGGRINKTKGNLYISKKYFPWLDKNSKSNKLTLELFGGQLYEYYEISQPQKTLWKPIIPEGVYVTSEYTGNPELDKQGKFARYSDGTVSQGDSNDEMYKKLLLLTSEGTAND